MIVVLLKNSDVEQKSFCVHLEAEAPCAVRCGRFIVERGENPSEVLKHGSLCEIPVVSCVLDIDSIFEKKIVCLLASRIVERSRRVVDLGEQAFCRVEMIGKGRIYRLGCKRPVAVDRVVAFCRLCMMSVEAEDSKQNESGCRHTECRPNPWTTQKFKRAAALGGEDAQIS